KKGLRWRREQSVSNRSLVTVPCFGANNREIRALGGLSSRNTSIFVRHFMALVLNSLPTEQGIFVRITGKF
ncbi:MAG: hypothetical protein M0Z28_07010, partial [Rhodospirillales bacterium]|nr:hypothetical protein [Rhodospirillales bacterium]